MNHFNRLVRNIICLAFCILGICFCVGLTLLMVLSNYLALEVSFDLLGFDKKPLDGDELLGPFFRVFLSKAGLSHLCAITIAFLIAWALFRACHHVFQIFELLRERRQYISLGDHQSAEIINQMILFDHLIKLGVYVFPLIFVVLWDIGLFRFRAIAGAASIESAELATQLSNWGLQIKENEGLWAWKLTQIGARGYLGIIAIACIGMECMVRKTSENWAKFTSTLEELFGSEAPHEGTRTSYASNLNGQLDSGHNEQIAHNTEEGLVARDDGIVEDSGLQTGDLGTSMNNQQAEPSTRPLSQASHCQRGAEAIIESPIEDRPEEAPLFNPRLSKQKESQGNTPQIPRQKDGSIQDRSDMERLQSTSTTARIQEAVFEVIGGAKDERVSLTTALAHPESYWVDQDTRQIWDVDYRRSLFGQEMQKAA